MGKVRLLHLEPPIQLSPDCPQFPVRAASSWWLHLQPVPFSHAPYTLFTYTCRHSMMFCRSQPAPPQSYPLAGILTSRKHSSCRYMPSLRAGTKPPSVPCELHPVSPVLQSPVRVATPFTQLRSASASLLQSRQPLQR